MTVLTTRIKKLDPSHITAIPLAHPIGSIWTAAELVTRVNRINLVITKKDLV